LVEQLKQIVISSQVVGFETLEQIVRQQSQRIPTNLARDVQTYLKNLEQLGFTWGVINRDKYSYRTKTYGFHNDQITMIPRRNDEAASFLALQTLLTTCRYPSQST